MIKDDEIIHLDKINDTDIVIRLINKSEISKWIYFMGRSSKDPMYSRYNYDFKFDDQEDSGDMDEEGSETGYEVKRENEKIVVAETVEEQEFIGTVRLILDDDEESAEFIVVVADKWRNHGLGSLLLNFTLKLAQNQDIAKVYAFADVWDFKIMKILKKFDFEVEDFVGENKIRAVKYFNIV